MRASFSAAATPRTSRLWGILRRTSSVEATGIGDGEGRGSGIAHKSSGKRVVLNEKRDAGFSAISHEVLAQIRKSKAESRGDLCAPPDSQAEASHASVPPERSSPSRANSKCHVGAFERSVIRMVRRKQMVGFRKHAIMLLDEPTSSVPARVLHVLLPCIIMLSVVVAIILSMRMDPPERTALVYVQTVCDAVFAIELLLRISGHFPDLWSLLTEPLFILDAVSSASPLIIDVFFETTTVFDLSFTDAELEARSFNLASRMRRLCVLTRTLKLVRHYDGARALAKALQRSAAPLLAPLFFTGAGILIFAGLMCVIEVEGSAEGDFHSIPDSMWFSVVTLTTLGYGDVVPHTNGGKAVTGLTAIIAVLFMAMPLTIVGNNFSECWNEREALTVIMRLQEFIMLHGLEAEDLLSIFKVFDRDGNGWLDIMEFKSVLEFLGLSVPRYKVRKLFRMFDKDGINQVLPSSWNKHFLAPPTLITRSCCVAKCSFLSDCAQLSKHAHAYALSLQIAINEFCYFVFPHATDEMFEYEAAANTKASFKQWIDSEKRRSDTGDESRPGRTRSILSSKAEIRHRLSCLPTVGLQSSHQRATPPSPSCNDSHHSSNRSTMAKKEEGSEGRDLVSPSPKQTRWQPRGSEGECYSPRSRGKYQKSAAARKELLLEQLHARERRPSFSEASEQSMHSRGMFTPVTMMEDARMQSSLLEPPPDHHIVTSEVLKLLKDLRTVVDDLSTRVSAVSVENAVGPPSSSRREPTVLRSPSSGSLKNLPLYAVQRGLGMTRSHSRAKVQQQATTAEEIE